MAKQYNISRNLQFVAQTGYWTLDITINSAQGVSIRPFLVERAVPGTASQNTIASSTEEPKFIRTLLESEASTQRTEEDTSTYDYFTWVQYRTNSVSRQFYTYGAAVAALESTLAILKSNVNKFDFIPPTPAIVCANLSIDEPKTQLEEIEATKGDVLTLQLIDGPRDTEIITDGEYTLISAPNSVGTESNLSYRVKLISSNTTYIGLRTQSTAEEYKVLVTMNSTPQEQSISEVIR